MPPIPKAPNQIGERSRLAFVRIEVRFVGYRDVSPSLFDAEAQLGANQKKCERRELPMIARQVQRS